MDEKRPDPDVLLEKLTNEQLINSQGKLKIFFGYAAGVGKTFTMLEAAHDAKTSGIDVVAGYIEPHTRPQTLALLEGFEVLPVLNLTYKNIILKEFDIDAAIKRKPQLILVDELAHTNADGCRHTKRYKDIEELLRQGIDVYTTVNVQHIESLNDIVASITGVIVQERIPDSVFDSADQVKLVDIEPDDLIVRLNQGKIYKENQAQKALGNFFTKENLTALREIALRRTADRVNKVVEKNKPVTNKSDYFTGEHVLVCLSSSPSNAKVIRAAARIADAFHGTFTALFVETSTNNELSDENKVRVQDNLKLAEQLGARIATVYGDDVPYQIVEYAKVSGISKIVVGRSNSKKILFFRRRSLVEKLMDLTLKFDIYVIPDDYKFSRYSAKKRTRHDEFSLEDTVKTVAISAIASLVGFLFFNLGFSEANIITVYILGVLFTALVTEGRIYSILSSIASVLCFNFFFTDPFFTFQSFDHNYPVTFATMFCASFITSTLTKRVKRQAYQASIKAYRTEILLETSQKLQRAKNTGEIIKETAQQMVKLLERDVVFYPVENNGLLSPLKYAYDKSNASLREYLSADEQAVAYWVYKNNKHAGATTNTLPGSKCLYMAVRSSNAVLAVVGVAMKHGTNLGTFEKNLLLAMLSECALALEKESMIDIKKKSEYW